MNSNKRLARNTSLLYLRMFVIMLVSLYTSRVILEQLGVEDFGIYNIVGGIVVSFSFFNSTLSLTTQRFLNFEIGKNNQFNITKIFSISITIHIIIIIFVVLLAETVGLWLLNHTLNIPPEKLYTANVVYQLSLFTLCISIIQAPYNACIIAYEKMSYYAYICIVEAGLKLLVAFSIIAIPSRKLAFYSFFLFIISAITFFCYRKYCKKHFTCCKYKYFGDREIFKSMFCFSSWTLGGQLAFVASNQGMNFLLNIFYGVSVNAAMGIANQVQNAMQSFVANFQTAFKPQIIQSYASNDKYRLLNLVASTSKISFFLMFAFVLPAILNMNEILYLWLKDVPAYSVVFSSILLVHTLFEAYTGPFWIFIHATGKIKNYQIAISIFYFLNLLLGYSFLKLGFPPQSVLYGLIITDIFITIVRMYFFKSQTGVSISSHLFNISRYIIPVVLLSIPIPLCMNSLNSHFSTVLSIFFSVLQTLILVYYLGLSSLEKKSIINILKRK